LGSRKKTVYAKKIRIPAYRPVPSLLTPSVLTTFWKPGATTAATASSSVKNGVKPWVFKSEVQSKNAA